MREARPQAPPRCGEGEPAAPSKNPYQQRERWNYPSQKPPDDQKSGVSQSSAAPSARSGRVSSTLLRAPPPRGYQAVPPAAGYQLVRVEQKWQQERLPEAQEPQENPPPANRYEELQRYGPEGEEDDIDVSDSIGISLEDMLHQEFERLLPPYTELKDERKIAHNMALHAVGTQAAYRRDRERYGPRRDREPRGRVPILASRQRGVAELGDTRDSVPPCYSGDLFTLDHFFQKWDIYGLQLCVGMARSDREEYLLNQFCYRLPKALQTTYLQDLADGKIKGYKQPKK